MMKPKWLVLFALSLFVRAFAQEHPQFSAHVQLVMVDVQVTEKGTGRVLELLGPKDFEIYDEGGRQEIREFHFETTPVDIVFLIYGRPPGWWPGTGNDLGKGLNAAAEQLRAGDRGAVLRSNSEGKIDLAMTDDKEKVRAALLRARYPPEYDRLYDAVNLATKLFSRPKDPARRRAIVAITDDFERGSKIKIDPLITELLEVDSTLNEVILVPGPPPSRQVGVSGPMGKPTISSKIGGSPRTGASLRDAVQATGGEAIPGDLLQERFPELIQRIRFRYLLGFYAEPTARREFHRIEVRLTPEAQKQCPNALIRARRGYYSVERSVTDHSATTQVSGRAVFWLDAFQRAEREGQRRVELRLSGKRKVKGTLVAVRADTCVVRNRQGTVGVPYEQIDSAKWKNHALGGPAKFLLVLGIAVGLSLLAISTLG